MIAVRVWHEHDTRRWGDHRTFKAVQSYFLRRRLESGMLSTTAVFLRRRASLMDMKRPVPASLPRWVVFFFFAIGGRL